MISNKKILLVLLPFWTPLLPPQGICRIKAFLQRHGYKVKTVDVNLETQFKKLYDRYFNILKKHIPANNRANFYNIGNDVWREHMMAHINYQDEQEYLELVKIIIYKTFYYSVDHQLVLELNKILTRFYDSLGNYFLALLAREKPGILGISVYRDTLAASLFAFKITRQRYPHIKTIMGGGIFTIQLTRGSPNLEFFMQKTEPYLDKIMIGSGEQLLLAYLQGKLPESQRVYTLKDICGPAVDVSAVSPADMSDFNPGDYHYLAAQASVGCPHQCSFCNVGSFYGDYRQKNIAPVVEQMMDLHKKYGLQLFYMLDALLNPVITKFAAELIKSGLSLYWDGYFRIDEAAGNVENAFLWRRGGFYRARIGVESGSQRVLDLMGKGITVEQTKAAVYNLAQAGIKTTTYIVIGHPGETEEDFRQTLDLVEELSDHIWEAECNPFTYIYSGQGSDDEWADKRMLLYPDSAKYLLINQTWIVNGEPSRKEMYQRVNRFVRHCKKLGISVAWSLADINKADGRWKKLHKNAVPSVLELTSKERYIDENQRVDKIYPALEVYRDIDSFNFAF
jgi:radical SAM superfamily enzyme YgiQ (UPF0313 family)